MRPAERMAEELTAGINDPLHAVRVLRQEGKCLLQAAQPDAADVLYEYADRLERRLPEEILRWRPANE